MPSGTYRILAFAPAGLVGVHKAKLRNITDSTDVIVGSNEVAPSGNPDNSQSSSIISGIFTITSQKTFEIQHRCGTTRNTSGFGSATNFSVVEVYTQVWLWKLA